VTASNSVFERKEGTGWTRGLDNLLGVELGRWFRTKKWWIQILVWAALVNLLLFFIVLSEGDMGVAEIATLFSVLLSTFATFGVCILMQGVIVGEKQSGTAAWILSKSVSRPAFVLAKLVGNTVGIAVTIVLAQGVIAYLIIGYTTGTALPALGFLGGLGVLALHLVFYITFTLMLGAALSRRGPVIAIPLVFFFAEQVLLGVFPVLAHLLPSTLTMLLDDSVYPSVAAALMTGSEPLSYVPLATTLGASVLFVAVALWFFERQEL
jgi:ABC-2 type transport system permease protein